MTERPWRLLVLPPLPEDLLTQLFAPVLADDRVELVVPVERTQRAVEEQLPEVDLVVGDWSPQLRLTAPGPRVAFVQQPSVGYDGVDVDAFAAAGVPVANTAGSNTTSVAEWCLGAVLTMLRRLGEADAAVRRGEWPQTTLGGRELAGSTVGVVGMGRIGAAVARTFRSLGCQVHYWSRTEKPDAPAVYTELDMLLRSSDVVVLVIALGAQTRHLLDARRLGLLRPGTLLVNAARGEVVDEQALVDVVREGHLGGVALDVFATEPLPAGSPLRDLPRVLLSPHAAGATVESAARVVARTTANLQRAVAGEPVLDVVNGADPQVRRRG